jgi:hypothetical protein
LRGPLLLTLSDLSLSQAALAAQIPERQVSEKAVCCRSVSVAHEMMPFTS